MPYTAQQQEEIKQSFADRRRRQYIVAAPFVILLIARLFVRRGDLSAEPFGVPVVYWVALVIAYVVGALVFSFRNWRCPACDKYLGKGIGPKFCPNCGVALQ